MKIKITSIYTKRIPKSAMNKTSQIQLKLESVLDLPIEIYDKDFTFIVNGEEYKTNRIIADLLSPTISNIHLTDPTINEFIITTQQKGNFSHYLNLINFKQFEIPEEEMQFIFEIIDILGCKSITICEPFDNTEITKDNIFDRISYHSRFSNFYSKSLKDDVDYISSHFFEICQNQKDQLLQLSVSTLQLIIANPKLLLHSEDQLIDCINELYQKNPDYSILYGYVNFYYVSSSKISDFLAIYDFNDITRETWKNLSLRLKQNISVSIKGNDRYCPTELQFPYQEEKGFNGIINYLKSISKDKIFDKIEIKSSSVLEGKRPPQNVIIYDNKNKDFSTKNEENSWISFDFKNYTIIPTNYTIQSFPRGSNGYAHPKSWVIEGSNDNKNWEIINEQTNSPALNGESVVHTFTVQKMYQKAYRYLKMRITGPNWGDLATLCFSAIEFYGTLCSTHA